MSEQDLSTIQPEPVNLPEEAPAARPRARTGLFLSLLAAVILLVGAAYLAARMLGTPTPSNAFGGPNGLVMTGNGGSGGMVSQSFQMNIDNAEEIPARTPDLHGIISEIKDNSLMVGANTNMIGTSLKVETGSEAEGPSETRIDFSGPLSEVVVTKETQIYIDTTFEDFSPDGNMPEEGETIQQTVESLPFQDLEKDNMVTVWGYKRGDRLIAEVIVYVKPVVFTKPASR